MVTFVIFRRDAQYVHLLLSVRFFFEDKQISEDKNNKHRRCGEKKIT
jgi:hypothetical protein